MLPLLRVMADSPRRDKLNDPASRSRRDRSSDRGARPRTDDGRTGQGCVHPSLKTRTLRSGRRVAPRVLVEEDRGQAPRWADSGFFVR